MSYKRWIAPAFATLFWLFSPSIPPAEAEVAEPRLALVIGNSNYALEQLAATLNNAKLIADTLRAVGFEVTDLANLDQEKTRLAFDEFARKALAAGPQTVLFVYFAGYGQQLPNATYFLPIDASIRQDDPSTSRALRISDLAQPLFGAGLKLRMFVFDLVWLKSNPRHGVNAALTAQDRAQDGTLYAFNPAPGQADGGYGAYAKALSQIMRTPGLSAADVFARARSGVGRVPEPLGASSFASGASSSFVFVQNRPAGATAASTANQLSPEEEAAWRSVKGKDTEQNFRDFLRRYPGSVLAPQAQASLETLQVRRGERPAPANKPSSGDPPAASSDDHIPESRGISRTRAPAPAPLTRELQGLRANAESVPPVASSRDPVACETAVPPFIPWPPPRATSAAAFSDRLSKFRKVEEFDAALRSALATAGYRDISYFSAPSGFVLATPVEKIDESGHPFPDSTRWLLTQSAPPAGIYDFFHKVLTDEEGYFRLFVFVITRDSRQAAEPNATFKEAQRWAGTGCRSLPRTMLDMAITPDHIAYVLTYVFSARKGFEPKQSDAFVPAAEQLKHAGIVF